MINYFIVNIFDFLGIAAQIFLFAVLSFFLTQAVRSKLIKSNILDTPNIRSMHTIPVPRGGGWAYVLLIFLWFFLLSVFSYFHNMLMAALDARDSLSQSIDYMHSIIFSFTLCMSLLSLVCVSWIDDKKELDARFRMLAHTFAACLVCYFLPIHQPLFLSWVPHTVFLVALILGWVGFINLYNFMDGIDGICGTQTTSICLGLIILSGLVDYHLKTEAINLSSVLIGCSIGFLFHNWHKAKIFLGDIGSIPLGFLIGYCLISFATSPDLVGYQYEVDGAEWNYIVSPSGRFFAALTLPLYYLADGGITLARRILRGEKFWEAHRTHFYQRAAQAAGRHDIVVLKIAACNVVLIGIAMLELLVSPWFVLAAPLPVALLLHNMAHQRHIGVKSPNG